MDDRPSPLTTVSPPRITLPPCAEARSPSLPWLSGAIQLDALTPRRVPLPLVWQRLIAGYWTARDAFSTDERHYLILVTNRDTSGAHAPRTSDVAVLRRVLLGESQKAIAIDLGRSNSTIANRLGRCLTTMGFSHRCARAPALLVAAAASDAGTTLLSHARIAQLNREGIEHTILSVARFEAPALETTTTAELKILKLVVDGLSRKQIAENRGKSQRTIANQLCSAFRKLGVSGRCELLACLVSGILQPQREPANQACFEPLG
jgi:DNA-binding NarL/FixJ family response regulator